MTTTEFRTRMAQARDGRARALGLDVPTGRSYLVDAPNANLAPHAARIAATGEGHRGARWSRVLHVERVDASRYEVVLEAR